ncbi:MAG: DUF4385 family protein [Kofleriaceae bacterium]
MPRIDDTIRRLLRERAEGKTICPSEVARALGDDAWRALMPRVREAAGKLLDRREIAVTQKGKPVDPRTARGPIRLARAAADPTRYADRYRGIDFRAHPELYRVGIGEQGVLIAEPYKSELLPLWRFRTPEIARASSRALWNAFVAYREARDFVGMDMARKFLQMGFTRSRRYANRKSGRKYEAGRKLKPRAPDETKAKSAVIFKAAWDRAERDAVYRAWRAEVTPRSRRR